MILYKIKELRSWILQACRDIEATKGILLISGPPGSAKETAVKSICHEQNISISEWKNTYGNGMIHSLSKKYTLPPN